MPGKTETPALVRARLVVGPAPRGQPPPPVALDGPAEHLHFQPAPRRPLLVRAGGRLGDVAFVAALDLLAPRGQAARHEPPNWEHKLPATMSSSRARRSRSGHPVRSRAGRLWMSGAQLCQAGTRPDFRAAPLQTRRASWLLGTPSWSLIPPRSTLPRRRWKCRSAPRRLRRNPRTAKTSTKSALNRQVSVSGCETSAKLSTAAAGKAAGRRL
jgi:hypothetical protein